MENLDLAIKAAILRGDITNPGIVDKGKSKETWKLITLRNSSGRTLSRIPLTKVAELRDKGVQFTDVEIKQLSSFVESSPKRLPNSIEKVLQGKNIFQKPFVPLRISQKKWFLTKDQFLKRKNIFYKTFGAVSTIGIIFFFANQTKIDTLTHKGKIYTASKACGFGKTMYWKTSAGFLGIGANAKEIGCMTKNEFKARENQKKANRQGILKAIAAGLQAFSEGYSAGSNQGNYTPNYNLQNQIQSNKFQQDLQNNYQYHQNRLQQNQQFNYQQGQKMQQFRDSYQYKPYGGYSSPYSY